MLIKGDLTDRKIEKYRKLGYYSSEYRAARKKLMDRKAFKDNMNRACGNFFESEDGRLIYSPL